MTADTMLKTPASQSPGMIRATRPTVTRTIAITPATTRVNSLASAWEDADRAPRGSPASSDPTMRCTARLRKPVARSWKRSTIEPAWSEESGLSDLGVGHPIEPWDHQYELEDIIGAE